MFETIIHWTTAALGLAGIFVMAAGTLLASLVALTRAGRGMAGSHLYPPHQPSHQPGRQPHNSRAAPAWLSPPEFRRSRTPCRFSSS